MRSLAELLRERALDVTRHLAAAIKGDIRGVHQGRVASRRLRESLPVTAAAGTAAVRARKTFRKITRALGPVRELDVALAHLEEGLDGARIPRMAIERVRAHVQVERERRRERMLARLERVDLTGAVGSVERIASRVRPALTERSAQALGRRVRDRALGLQLAIERAGTLYHPERLHEVRIAAKKLRYALEVVSAASLANVGPAVRELKRVQELLGVMHDYQVLLEHVKAVADATPARRRGSREGGPRRAPGVAGLNAMAAAYDRECRKLHAAYLKCAPSLGKTAAALGGIDLKVRNTRTG